MFGHYWQIVLKFAIQTKFHGSLTFPKCVYKLTENGLMALAKHNTKHVVAWHISQLILITKTIIKRLKISNRPKYQEFSTRLCKFRVAVFFLVAIWLYKMRTKVQNETHFVLMLNGENIRLD